MSAKCIFACGKAIEWLVLCDVLLRLHKLFLKQCPADLNAPN